MSPTKSSLRQTLRRLVLRLVMLLDGFLGLRRAWLCARIDALPANHKRRRALERELARLDRACAVLTDPDNHEDLAFRGLLAEIARVRADTGRRGWMALTQLALFLVIGALGTGVGAALGLTVSYVCDRYKLLTLPGDVYQITHVPFRAVTVLALESTVSRLMQNPGNFADEGRSDRA